MSYVLFLTLIVSVMMMCFLLIYSFLHAEKRGVLYLVWVMVFRVIFGCSIILELYSNHLSVKFLFRQMQQMALVMVVPFVVLCVLDLYGKDKWLKWYKQLAILFGFICWSLLIWTNDQTQLVYHSITMNNGKLEVTQTMLAILFNTFCFVILIVCVYYLILYFRKVRPELWKPGIFIILLASAPGVIEIIKFIYPGLYVSMLPLSMYGSFFGMIALWIVYKNDMFTIVPLARDFIIDTIREGILTVNQHGKVIDCNQFIQPLFAEEDGPIIGQNISVLLSRWPDWLESCQGLQENTLEITMNINNQQKYYLTKIYPLHSKRGFCLGTVSILIDITEKQERLNEIVHLNFLREQLFTLVSHDIREPIATQVGLIEILEEEKQLLTSDNAVLVDFLGNQIRTTYMTVNNMLEWFRTQKEDLLLHPESLVLIDLIEEAYRFLYIKGQEKQINLQVDVKNTLYVYVDREAIIMVIRNLLSNAIKFSKYGGTVKVLAWEENGEIIISVNDEGIGMTEENLRLLYEGEQLVSRIGTAGEKGTGLGLQVSRQFIKMSGSNLKIVSELGKGSSFQFSLKAGEEIEGNHY